MDAGLKAWAEIVRGVYPDLTILRDRTQWLAGNFDTPSVFIETDLVSDKTHTPRADRVVEDVGLVFHFDKERVTEEDEGEPIPLIWRRCSHSYGNNGFATLQNASVWHW